MLTLKQTSVKKLFLSVVFIFAFIGCFAQPDGKVTIGNIDSIDSKILHEKRKIWVHVPSSDPGGIYTKQRYPVVYLLDGDAHFYSVVGMIQQLSTVNGNTICPDMIVVGIPNTDRMRDLTPSNDSLVAPTTGGGEKLMEFMEKELMPYIEANYPTQPYKMLIGHSLGGLMVMNAVINHTQMFNSYICIDPSMWYDKQKLLKAGEKIIPKMDFKGISLYLGIANTMEKGMDVKKVVADTASITQHIRSILEMDKFIRSQNPMGLQYASKYYENDNHGSVPLITEYDALHFIFSKYKIDLVMSDYMDSTVDLVAKYVLHYKEVSKLFGFTMKPPEGDMNGMAYQLLQMKQVKKAGGIFKMNVENYPESFNAYDSYGDYFAAIGDKSSAIENFKKALSLKENPESRTKLNKLLE